MSKRLSLFSRCPSSSSQRLSLSSRRPSLSSQRLSLSSRRLSLPSRRLPFSSQCLFIFALLLLFFLSGCGKNDASHASNPTQSGYAQLQESVLKEQDRFDAFCDELFQAEITENTISLHYNLTRPEDSGISDYTVTLGAFGEETHQEALLQAEKTISRLMEFSYDDLTAGQQQTFDILVSALHTELSSGDYYLYAEPLTTNTGIHIQLPVLLAEYRFERLQDVDQYLLLLADVPRYFGNLLNFERAKSAAGLFMCDALADQVISACTDFIAQPENNYLISLFDEKLDALELTDSSLALSYKEKNASLVQNSVIPAYQALAKGISGLKGSGSGENGLSSFPLGQSYYTWLVRSGTGSKRTPEEMIAWLEEDISQSLTDLAAQLKSNPSLADSYLDFQFPISNPQEILADLQQKIQADFPACPAVDSSVQYIHPSLEESSSPAFYLTPPMDQLTEQRIYINGSADTDHLYPTLAHEGYPGHLYQNVYFAAQNTCPLRCLLNFPGYTEGWATYAEMLSYQYCEGENPETLRLMQTFFRLNLKASALSDLYVHHKGYTETELADFLSSVFGISRETSRDIYLRLLGDPGNYLSYVIGCMEIEALREKAEDTLGPRFQAKEFHQFLLEFGPAPFDIIEKYLDDWIAETQNETSKPQ